MEAKKRGEKVAWVSSNFPVEIPETMGIATVYPENQAAGIAARGAGTRMCEEAESEGYSNDICAYARVSLAYAKLKSCPEQDVPMPDVLLCCSNICSCMIKWYENLARELNIPMILLDIPFNPDYEVSDAEVAYVTGQFWDAVKQLEEITGKKWSDERFKEVTGFTLPLQPRVAGRDELRQVCPVPVQRFRPAQPHGRHGHGPRQGQRRRGDGDAAQGV